jgi:cytoskeletal protein CcmA (bactofilin family)
LSSRRPAARPPLPSPPAEQSPSAESNAVRLGPRDRLIGRLYIEGDLHVNGTVEGAVEATGDVEIDEMAKVKASVAGRQVSIRGRVSGPVTARERLVVASSGSLIGDVRVPRLVVQDGATFSGNVSMGPAAEMALEAAEPADTVATASEPSAPKAQGVAVVPDDGKAGPAGKKRKPNRR